MKNILIAVSGTSPQVISETLYCYVVKEKIQINEIYIITTALGQKVFTETIQAQNIIFNLYNDYHLDTAKLPPVKFIILVSENGRALDDIRTRAENRITARIIIDFVAEKSKEAATAMFCSIAGGRKTMSAYLALALNLFGRECDRLSHVLVSPERLTKDPTFFYPAKNDKEIDIELAHLPFIRLRNKLYSIINDPRLLSFEELMNISNLDLSQLERQVKVRLDPGQKNIIINWDTREYVIHLQPKLFAIYDYLFRSANPVLLAGNKELAALYQNKYGHGNEGVFDEESVVRDVSDINHKNLNSCLPGFLVVLLRVSANKESPEKLYYIPINNNNRELSG